MRLLRLFVSIVLRLKGGVVLGDSPKELIRKEALKVLKEHPLGIRYYQLRSIVEENLKHIIEPDTKSKSTYRGALYDLEKRYPEEVEKIREGRKKVFLRLKTVRNNERLAIQELIENLNNAVNENEKLVSYLKEIKATNLTTDELINLKSILDIVEQLEKLKKGE